MADNYLITGYWGEPHITPENDRGINAATFGKGRFILPVGEQLRAEYIGNNTVRLYDGKLIDNGAIAGIPAGEYVDLLIPETSQGMKRNDLIVFQYSKDNSTLIESGKFVVIQGTETSGTASDPELTQQDLLSGEATFDQMALYRVSVSGAKISEPESIFNNQSCTLSNQVCESFSAYTDNEIDKAINTVWETMGNDSIRFISIYIGTADLSLPGGVWFIQINKQTADFGSINAISHGNYGVRKMSRSKYASWQPWEYENPPMYSAVEYRTTERWQGKPIYTKLVEYTANSNIGSSNSSFGFSVSFSTPNFKNLIRYCGTIEGAGRAIPCFYNPEEGGGYIGINFMNHQGVAVEMNKVTLTAGTKVVIQVWYTKTTD